MSCAERVHLDAVLQQTGSFGRYQLVTMALLAVPLEAIHSTHYVFTAADTRYRCSVGECDGIFRPNPSHLEGWAGLGAYNSSQQCLRYRLHSTTNAETLSTDACAAEDNNTGPVTCSAWVYENKESLVAEFQLACEPWKRTLVGTTRSAGALVGLLVAGLLSDRFGRKVVIHVSGTMVGVFGVGKTFSTSYFLFIGLEFVDALFGAALYNVMFTYSIEIVNKDKRVWFSCCLGILYSIGGAFFAVIAWMVPYWRLQLRIVYAPAILLFLYAFLLDESVRWLLSKGMKDEAIKIIIKIAQRNSIAISNNTLANLHCEDPKSSITKTNISPFVETFRSKEMMFRLASCCVWWVSCVFVYYGMTIDSVSLGGDKYVNFALSCLMDIPSCLVCAYVLDRFERRRSLMLSFTAAGILCVAMVFEPKTMTWLTTVIFLLGKFAISFTFGAIYMYTSELFPTYTRNSMHAACSCVGRIGSLVAPQMPLLATYWANAPAVLYAACALTSALLTLPAPDTRHARLPDTVLQAQRVHTPRATHDA